MRTSATAEVAVVGASLAGLTTALGLARAGVGVTLVDTVAPPRLTWTAVHHWAVLPLLDQLGVLDRALLEGEATACWGWRVLGTGERLAFDVRELGPEVRLPFNLRLEPAALRAILRDALLTCPMAEVVTDARIADLRQHPDGVEVFLDDPAGARSIRSLHARWVVGADGPASEVRRRAGLAFEGMTWTERCVVALVQHDFAARDYDDTTFQIDGRWGAVVERAGHQRWRYLFQESLSHSEGETGHRIDEVLRAVTGEQPEVLDWTASRMHQRSATSYRNGRLLLVGDAAHLTHPMTGHTSLSGWFDAASLVSALLEERTGGAQAGDVLTRWAQWRRRHFLDDAAPASLGRRNLVAQIRDARRLEIELDVVRRATVDPARRREALLAERDSLVPSGPGVPSF